MPKRPVVASSLALAVVFLAGCGAGSSPPAARQPRPKPPNIYGPADFLDAAQTNVQVEPADLDLVFVDTRGETIDLSQFRGKKNVVLVFTRGFYGQLCPYCTTQVSRLIAQYDEIARRDGEVLVVFPGDNSRLGEFLQAARREAQTTAAVPFPIVLDADYKAVNQLDIRGNQAKPSTYILDKEGNVRLAYVGAFDADRPSVKAILDQLDLIQSEQPPAESPAEESAGKLPEAAPDEAAPP